jgi:hypothetical protein
MDLWQKAGLEPAGATFGEAKAMAAAIRIQGIRTLCSTKGPIKREQASRLLYEDWLLRSQSEFPRVYLRARRITEGTHVRPGLNTSFGHRCKINA